MIPDAEGYPLVVFGLENWVNRSWMAWLRVLWRAKACLSSSLRTKASSRMGYLVTWKGVILRMAALARSWWCIILGVTLRSLLRMMQVVGCLSGCEGMGFVLAVMMVAVDGLTVWGFNSVAGEATGEVARGVVTRTLFNVSMSVDMVVSRLYQVVCLFGALSLGWLVFLLLQVPQTAGEVGLVK